MKGFYIEIINNLLEPKHRKRMKESVWLFMWLLDKITSISEDGIGTVLGGKPIKYEEVNEELDIPERTYYRWINQLKMNKYINTKKAPQGLIITVNKAKKRFHQRPAKNGKTSPAKKCRSVLPKSVECPAKKVIPIHIQDKDKTTTMSQECDTNNIHLEVRELFDYYKQQFQKKISEKAPIFNWGQCERNSKRWIKELGLESMKKLIDEYLDSNDILYKENAYSLSCFLSTKILHRLNQK